jgi:beta-lactam-binding protein with PASTA domain
MASCIIRRGWFGTPAAGVMPKVKVPALSGLTEAAAIGTFTPMLRAGVRSTGPGGTPGTINAQTPAANTVVKMGSAVAYTVAT